MHGLPRKQNRRGAAAIWAAAIHLDVNKLREPKPSVKCDGMSRSPLRLFKRALIHRERDAQDGWRLPAGTRGIYILYNQRARSKDIFEVVYIGVGGTKLKRGIGERIWNHRRDGKKSKWTHYSIFEVHDNISGEEILELRVFCFKYLSWTRGCR